MTDVQNLVNMVLGASDVQHLSIDELFNLRNGYTPSKSEPKFWTGGTIPWFVMDDIRQNGTILSDSIQHITSSAVKGNLFPVDSIIVSTSATIGSHALIKVPFLCNQRFTCLMLKDKYKGLVDMKYIYYYMDKVDEWCKENTYQSSFQTVDMDGFRNILIPIPSLEVQFAVVEIMDYFSNLQNCVDSEYYLRIDQFQDYLESIMKNPKLIDSSVTDADVRKYKLSEVARVIMGTSPKSQFISSDPIGIEFHQGNTSFGDGVLDHSGKFTSSPIKTAKSGSLLMSVRAPVGDITFTNRDVAIGRGLCSIEPSSEIINEKYLYYFLKFSADEIKKGTFGSMFESIDSDSVSSIVVKVPPIFVQDQIVEILDYFANLVVDVRNESISRRLQLEYYLRMLFSFRGGVV